MNTIEITTDNSVINYTETEVKRFIEKAGETRDIKYKVRDFFSELGWEDGEVTINRNQVNELLGEIGCNKLRVEYRATVTIIATVSGFSAEDEDEAAECIADEISVELGSGNIGIDNIEVADVEEE